VAPPSLAAIHQPTFLPWLGLFDKVSRSSLFVFFDTVQYPRGKTWCSRVRILVNGSPTWVTMPVVRNSAADKRIDEVEMVDPDRHWRKILERIRHAYARAPFVDDVFEFLQADSPAGYRTLADFNVEFVRRVSSRLALAPSFVRASERDELKRSTTKGTEAIVETCRVFGIVDYLSGDGTDEFLEPELFGEAGIRLQFQQFRHPTYPQLQTDGFHPGLSIVDALMNCGWQGTAELLR